MGSFAPTAHPSTPTPPIHPAMILCSINHALQLPYDLIAQSILTGEWNSPLRIENNCTDLTGSSDLFHYFSQWSISGFKMTKDRTLAYFSKVHTFFLLLDFEDAGKHNEVSRILQF
ncbi:hypothetical protein TNIN_356791 [Trichonephila inaurata madagascariensis]|uniref:Uncharacterized protein n=1 Tax=Trichonephila inaurata madagascariensis TaxID=2747483 RepID=A0A8X6JI45_9ARAC|nr:hypothetical protein TNIN_356791 [Trichonephila inaurata madagascariensis]